MPWANDIEGTNAMSAAANAKMIEGLYAAGMAPKVLFGMVDPDVIVICEAETLPYGGEYRGVEGFKALGQKIFGAFASMKADFHGCTASEDTVVAEITITLTGNKTGKTLACPALEMFKIKDGKIVEIRPFYWDTAAVNKAAAEL